MKRVIKSINDANEFNKNGIVIKFITHYIVIDNKHNVVCVVDTIDKNDFFASYKVVDYNDADIIADVQRYIRDVAVLYNVESTSDMDFNRDIVKFILSSNRGGYDGVLYNAVYNGVGLPLGYIVFKVMNNAVYAHSAYSNKEMTTMNIVYLKNKGNGYSLEFGELSADRRQCDSLFDTFNGNIYCPKVRRDKDYIDVSFSVRDSISLSDVKSFIHDDQVSLYETCYTKILNSGRGMSKDLLKFYRPCGIVIRKSPREIVVKFQIKEIKAC